MYSLGLCISFVPPFFYLFFFRAMFSVYTTSVFSLSLHVTESFQHTLLRTINYNIHSLGSHLSRLDISLSGTCPSVYVGVLWSAPMADSLLLPLHPLEWLSPLPFPCTAYEVQPARKVVRLLVCKSKG